MSPVRTSLLLALFAIGCSTGLEPDDTGSDTDAGSDTDTGDDTDSGSDTDTDTGFDTDTGTDTDSGTTGCVDDTRNNDVDTNATAVAATSSTTGQICVGDTDWFSVPLGAGCVVDVLLDFAVAEGDLDMILYDAAGDAVGLGWTEADDELVTYIHGGAASTLYVEVYGYDDAEAAYTLQVTSTCNAAPSCPTDDLFEQNDTLATAAPLNLFHTEVPATICTGDVDWYEVPFVPFGCRVDADLQFDEGAADLDLFLYDPLEYLAGSSTTSDSDELTAWYADIEGPVYIAVAGFEGDAGAYTLTTDLWCPDYEAAPTCPDDDWFEENDTEGAATWLNDTYTYVEAAMCDAIDLYWALIPAGCIYQAQTVFDGDAMDLDMDIYDYGFEATIAWSEGVGDSEFVSYIADIYTVGEIGVWSLDGTGGYTLETVLVCPDADGLSCPDDDIFEENETASMPLNQDYTLLEAIACGGDTDFYAVFVPDGCTLDAYLTHGTGGDLDLYLYDGATEVDSSLNYPPDDEALSFTVSGDTWLDLEVWPEDGSAEYLLETDITCP